MKHNWTPETMDKCRRVFLDDIIWYYFNCGDEDFKKAKIYEFIERYFEIKKDISKMKSSKEEQ